MVTRTYRTVDRHGYNVKFSPFTANRLACATCENYGISGKGTVYVFDEVPEGTLSLIVECHWKEGLFDVTWSELNANILISSSADGSIQFWDVNQPQNPVALLQEHSKVVCSIDWSQTRTEQYLLSGSWDQTAKVWDVDKCVAVSTYAGHRHQVNCVMWSPLLPGCFASVSGDGMLRIWDIKQPGHRTSQFLVHSGDVLSCDWCKYNKNVIVTCGADALIRGWDVRNPKSPVFQLFGHEYAVRRVKFSPHEESVLCSVSYDLTTRIWDWNFPEPIQTLQHHKEFVYGLDFNTHIKNEIADCAWDELIHIFNVVPGTSTLSDDTLPENFSMSA